MLEQKDFDVLKNMMESVLHENLTKSENLILEEMERTREILDKRIEKVLFSSFPQTHSPDTSPQLRQVGIPVSPP